jgi:hypothetical protein
MKRFPCLKHFTINKTHKCVSVYRDNKDTQILIQFYSGDISGSQGSENEHGWVTAPCSFVDVYRRFRDYSCLHHQIEALIMALKLEASNTSETSVNSYQSTRRYNAEDGHLNFILTRCKFSNYGMTVLLLFFK